MAMLAGTLALGSAAAPADAQQPRHAAGGKGADKGKDKQGDVDL